MKEALNCRQFFASAMLRIIHERPVLTRTMKRSHTIHLTIVTSLAAALTGCQEKSTRYCVDADNKVVDERQCKDEQRPSGSLYHWYYGGAHGFIPIGTRLRGGSTVEPAEGSSNHSSEGTVRGGIGSTGEAVSSGGSGEAGAGE